MADLFRRMARGKKGSDRELPRLACRALGKDPACCGPLGDALLCAYISIVLVDDILDDDPRGEYRQIGAGPAANLAAAFQAAAFSLAGQVHAPPETRLAILSAMAEIFLATAYGQHLDVQPAGGETDYWRVLEWKGGSFYRATLQLGALAGGAGDPMTRKFRELGALIGEIVQISDDLHDVFATPAAPDWKGGRNSLPLVYALTADHADRQRFRELLDRIDEPSFLSEAQRLLIRSGAVSYCVYQLLLRYEAADRLLQAMALPCPGPLADVFRGHVRSLQNLLELVQPELPSRMFPRFEYQSPLHE